MGCVIALVGSCEVYT